MSVLPFFRLSFRLSGRFLGIVSLHNMVLETNMKLCTTAWFSRNVFAPKIRKMAQKQGFWNLLKNFVITFFWICSIMKIYIISCVPAQIPYLEKYLFLRYRPKCSQPIRLQDFLINHISRTNQWNSLIFTWWCKFTQFKSWSKNLRVGMVRDGCGQPGYRTLKFTLSKMNRWMNWFFICWCKFRKVKSNSMIFGWMWSKNGCGHLVHETLKSTEFVYELCWYFASWLWFSNIW